MSKGKELLSPVFETFLILLADIAAGEISFLALDSVFPCNFLIFATIKENAFLCYRSAAAFVVSVVFSLPLVLLATQLMISWENCCWNTWFMCVMPAQFGFPYEIFYRKVALIMQLCIIHRLSVESSSLGLNPPWSQSCSQVLCGVPPINTGEK